MRAGSVRQIGRLAARREGRIRLDAAQQVEREVGRLVVLGFWRNIGLRSALFLANSLEMPAQR